MYSEYSFNGKIKTFFRPLYTNWLFRTKSATYSGVKPASNSGPNHSEVNCLHVDTTEFNHCFATPFIVKQNWFLRTQGERENRNSTHRKIIRGAKSPSSEPGFRCIVLDGLHSPILSSCADQKSLPFPVGMGIYIDKYLKPMFVLSMLFKFWFRDNEQSVY